MYYGAGETLRSVASNAFTVVQYMVAARYAVAADYG